MNVHDHPPAVGLSGWRFDVVPTRGRSLALALSLLTSTVPALANGLTPAGGEFTVVIDFPSLTLMPVGSNCLLEVDGEAVFTGTLEGIAMGTTRALVLAPCDAVAVNPPGAFKDVFRSKLEFVGTVDGEPAIADLTYRGITEVGGGIAALFQFSNGLKGVLQVEAIVAVGGSYQGFVKVE